MHGAARDRAHSQQQRRLRDVAQVEARGEARPRAARHDPRPAPRVERRLLRRVPAALALGAVLVVVVVVFAVAAASRQGRGPPAGRTLAVQRGEQRGDVPCSSGCGTGRLTRGPRLLPLLLLLPLARLTRRRGELRLVPRVGVASGERARLWVGRGEEFGIAAGEPTNGTPACQFSPPLEY